MSVHRPRLVEGQVALHRVDQVDVGDRVAQPLLRHRARQHAEELVVATDPGQVALVLLRPRRRGRRGWSPGSRSAGGGPGRPRAPGSRSDARSAARWLSPELTDWLPFTPPPVGAQSNTEHRERHVDAAERVDDVGELVEVERDRVLDRDPEVLFDRRDELGQSLVQTRVDLVRAGRARALGTNRSRGIERSARRWWLGSACRIMMTSLLTPFTPCEHRPYAGFWRSARTERSTRPSGCSRCRPPARW